MNKARAALAVGALAVLAATGLTGCSGSANSTACKLYEDAYNRLTDSVRNKQDADFVKAQSNALPSRLGDAFDKASGDVAIALRDARDLAQGMIDNPGNEDTGTAFFLQSSDVVKACAADGASISLHKTS